MQYFINIINGPVESDYNNSICYRIRPNSRECVDRVVKMAIFYINKKCYFVLFRSAWLPFHNKTIFHTDSIFPTKCHFFVTKNMCLPLKNFQDSQPTGNLHKICYTNYIFYYVTPNTARCFHSTRCKYQEFSQNQVIDKTVGPVRLHMSQKWP